MGILSGRPVLGLARWIWAVILVAALILAGFLLANSLARGNGKKVEAELRAGQADAGIASGQDAANTVAGAGAREGAIDQQTRDNEHAIHSAPGADNPVDNAVHGVGIDGLCKRAAYHRDPRCLPHPTAD